MRPSDDKDRKEPGEEPRASDAPVVVPFRPRATPRRPSPEPDDPGPDSAA
jgi:hypothetical protein